ERLQPQRQRARRSAEVLGEPNGSLVRRRSPLLRPLRARQPVSRARRSARRLRSTLTRAWAAATFASPARAQPGTSTTRVGDGGAPRVGARLSSLPPAPRLELGLSLDTQYFDRARAGSEAYTKLPLGSVWVNRLSLSAQLELASLTSVGVRVPTGVVSVKPPEAPSHSSTGLGDVELFVAQELLTPLRSLGGAGARPKTPVRLILRAGVVAPTGVYEPDSQLTLTDVSGGPGGSIGVNTYNTRTSLGGGSWAASGALTLHWQLSSRTAMQLETA